MLKEWEYVEQSVVKDFLTTAADNMLNKRVRELITV